MKRQLFTKVDSDMDKAVRLLCKTRHMKISHYISNLINADFKAGFLYSGNIPKPDNVVGLVKDTKEYYQYKQRTEPELAYSFDNEIITNIEAIEIMKKHPCRKFLQY